VIQCTRPSTPEGDARDHDARSWAVHVGRRSNGVRGPDDQQAQPGVRTSQYMSWGDVGDSAALHSRRRYSRDAGRGAEEDLRRGTAAARNRYHGGNTKALSCTSALSCMVAPLGRAVILGWGYCSRSASGDIGAGQVRGGYEVRVRTRTAMGAMVGYKQRAVSEPDLDRYATVVATRGAAVADDALGVQLQTHRDGAAWWPLDRYPPFHVTAVII
jgi:hypothetical protein